MELNQAIQKLIDENDVDILKERRFLTLLNEYLAFADMPFAAQMLQQIYNNGYGTKIHKIYCNKNSDDVTAFLSELRNKFGFDIVMLRKVFGEFGFPIVSKQKTKQNQIPCTFDDMELIRYEGRKAYKDEYGGIYSYPNAEIFYKLEDAQIPYYSIREDTKVIYNEAFEECNLMQVTIPNTVVCIGDYAFKRCSSLQQINIPDSITSIGRCAFEFCSSLQQISIPDSVTSIGHGAFCLCSSSLHTITFGCLTPPQNIVSVKSNRKKIFLGIDMKGKEIYFKGLILVPEGALQTYRYAWNSDDFTIAGY